MPGFQPPTENDLQNDKAFGLYVNNQHRYQNGAPKSSSSVLGTPQFATTSFTVSDILQGTFNVKDQSDTMLVVNKALTQDLSGLYNKGVDSLSSFSTAPPDNSLSNGFSGTAAAGSGGAGTVNKAWVLSLPVVDTKTNALIWKRQGKSSIEMHIPVADNLKDDINNHDQYPELLTMHKHPFYMDRIGDDWMGGENIPNTPDTGTVGHENADLPGKRTAFGYLAPLEEKFYCSMAWPFKGTEDKFEQAGLSEIAQKASLAIKSSYRGKKVLVYSTVTQLAVVCTPGDWGPNPYYTTGAVNKDSIEGFIMGLSPDVHHALGTKHGDEVILGWLDDSAPLGPYNPTPSQSLSSTDIPSSVGGGMKNTIEEIKYAGNKILNHPNNWMVKNTDPYSKQLVTILTQGCLINPNKDEVIYKDTAGREYLVPSLLNYMWIMMEGGYILDQYLGSIGHRETDLTAHPNAVYKLGNHSIGGAIDIGKIGREKDRKTFKVNDQANCRPILDELFTYLASLPRDSRPTELGCSFSYDYANGFHVYTDPNPTHIHLGFSANNAGTLMRQLLPPTTNNASTAIRSA